jgi:hypothetical protein
MFLESIDDSLAGDSLAGEDRDSKARELIELQLADLVSGFTNRFVTPTSLATPK